MTEKQGNEKKVAARSLQHLEVLARVGRSLLDTLDLDEQLGLTLKLATEALAADRGSIMIADDDQSELRIRASVGLPAKAKRVRVPFGEGISGWVASNQEALLLHGEVRDPRFEGVDGSIESSLSLPLAVERRVVGVLNAVRQSGERFTEEDMQLASSLADMASVAIAKSRLHRELSDREARVSDLLAAAIGAQEHERTRIAADIHDGFLQDLSALYLKAENTRTQLQRGETEKAAESLKEMQEMLRYEVKALRDYIFEVRPPSLDEVGLGPTLQAMVDRVGEETGMKGEFESGGGPDRFSRPLETIVYRTAQEALRNIVKHSGASKFWVTLQTRGDEVMLSIRDDGRGIGPEGDERAGHYGIRTMRERVGLSGGNLKVRSRRGGGTEVVATIPLKLPDPPNL